MHTKRQNDDARGVRALSGTRRLAPWDCRRIESDSESASGFSSARKNVKLATTLSSKSAAWHFRRYNPGFENYTKWPDDPGLENYIRWNNDQGRLLNAIPGLENYMKWHDDPDLIPFQPI